MVRAVATVAVFASLLPAVALPQNLLPNPDFDTSLTPWGSSTTGQSSVGWTSDAGSPATGAAALASLEDGTTLPMAGLQSACFNISQLPLNLLFSVKTLVYESMGSVSYGSSVLFFGGLNCSTPVVASVSPVPAGTDPGTPSAFTVWQMRFARPSAESFRVRLSVAATGNPSRIGVYFDSIYLGPDIPDVIFVDGFE